MAEWKVEGPELKKLVKLTKKKPLGFAYAPGKKAEDRLVALDRRKTGPFLGKNLKKESNGPKVAFGTASLNGKLWTLTCEKVVPTMAKTLKAYLKTQNIKVNIEVLDADGTSIESDIEDLPDDPDLMDDDPSEDADEALEDQPEIEEEQDDETRKKELAQRIKATQHDVMGADGPIGETLKKVLAAAVSLLRSGDLDKAEETVGKLEAALAKVGAAAPKKPEEDQQEANTGPDAVILAGRAQALKSSIAAVAEPARSKLLTALGAAAQAIKGGQLSQAEGALDKIEAALEKLGSGGAPADENPELAAARERLAQIQETAKAMENQTVGAKVIAASAKAAETIEAGDAAKAGQILDMLEKAIDDAGGSAPAAESGAHFSKSHDSWVQARSNMRNEIATLKAAIDKATADAEGFEDVASHSDKLFAYLDGFDGQLEDTLKQIMAANDEEQEALKATAQSIVARYRSELDNDFFQAVDQNGFVSTNIRGAAQESLDIVSQALAA